MLYMILKAAYQPKLLPKDFKMINEKSKTFWQKYASHGDLSLFSMMNLQIDPSLSQQKFYHELEIVLRECVLNNNQSLLDLGGGVGLWSREFIKKVAEVTLVEREPLFIEKAKTLLANEKRCRIINADSTTYYEQKSFDIIFMSGLTIYLDDISFNEMLENLNTMSRKGTEIIHRDAYGVEERFILNEKQSEALGEKYTAQYRTRQEYDDLFAKHGYEKSFDIDMYPDDQRWVETDLRLAKYIKL